MGLDLREKFKNIKKKHVIIAVVVLFVAVICTYLGFEYYGYQRFKAEQAERINEAAAKQMMPDISERPKKPSEYNIGVEYNKALKGNKPVMALFYADWCGYCIRFMPIYQEISEKYAKDLEFTKVNVEDENYKDVVKNIGITGFPTVFLLDPKYDNKILISNANLSSVETLSEDLDRFIRIRKLLDKKN